MQAKGLDIVTSGPSTNSTVHATVSVVIPTFERVDELVVTLDKIRSCQPAPAEIIVHVDGGDRVTARALREFRGADLKVLHSQKRLGPGGGRNRAIAAALHEIVVSLDDDSFPLDGDFFARVTTLIDRFPMAAVVGATIYHRDEPLQASVDEVVLSADFVGCGCVYRRSAFLGTLGYQPLTMAYGTEEVDVALQLHDQEATILLSRALRVRHDTDRSHQASARVTAAHITNTALLAWLRYPVTSCWFGAVQVASRVLWPIKNGRVAGILTGLVAIPIVIWRHRHARHPIRQITLERFLRLRRAAIDPHFDA
ncbi:MAG: glycosyltransferase family 2 protein [Chromatiales bacterium]|jgi:glycosyltransferase involved in cell wall biosynthesis|nr:glycosyltransferase family 2 protein [Chromatiales bacterium]